MNHALRRKSLHWRVAAWPVEKLEDADVWFWERWSAWMNTTWKEGQNSSFGLQVSLCGGSSLVHVEGQSYMTYPSGHAFSAAIVSESVVGGVQLLWLDFLIGSCTLHPAALAAAASSCKTGGPAAVANEFSIPSKERQPKAKICSLFEIHFWVQVGLLKRNNEVEAIQLWIPGIFQRCSRGNWYPFC